MKKLLLGVLIAFTYNIVNVSDVEAMNNNSINKFGYEQLSNVDKNNNADFLYEPINSDNLLQIIRNGSTVGFITNGNGKSLRTSIESILNSNNMSFIGKVCSYLPFRTESDIADLSKLVMQELFVKGKNILNLTNQFTSLVNENNEVFVPNSCNSAYDALVACYLMIKRHTSHKFSFQISREYLTTLNEIIKDIGYSCNVGNSTYDNRLYVTLCDMKSVKDNARKLNTSEKISNVNNQIKVCKKNNKVDESTQTENPNSEIKNVTKQNIKDACTQTEIEKNTFNKDVTNSKIKTNNIVPNLNTQNNNLYGIFLNDRDCNCSNGILSKSIGIKNFKKKFDQIYKYENINSKSIVRNINANNNNESNLDNRQNINNNIKNNKNTINSMLGENQTLLIIEKNDISNNGEKDNKISDNNKGSKEENNINKLQNSFNEEENKNSETNNINNINLSNIINIIEKEENNKEIFKSVMLSTPIKLGKIDKEKLSKSQMILDSNSTRSNSPASEDRNNNTSLDGQNNMDNNNIKINFSQIININSDDINNENYTNNIVNVNGAGNETEKSNNNINMSKINSNNGKFDEFGNEIFVSTNKQENNNVDHGKEDNLQENERNNNVIEIENENKEQNINDNKVTNNNPIKEPSLEQLYITEENKRKNKNSNNFVNIITEFNKRIGNDNKSTNNNSKRASMIQLSRRDFTISSNRTNNNIENGNIANKIEIKNENNNVNNSNNSIKIELKREDDSINYNSNNDNLILEESKEENNTNINECNKNDAINNVEANSNNMQLVVYGQQPQAVQSLNKYIESLKQAIDEDQKQNSYGNFIKNFVFSAFQIPSNVYFQIQSNVYNSLKNCCSKKKNNYNGKIDNIKIAEELEDNINEEKKNSSNIISNNFLNKEQNNSGNSINNNFLLDEKNDSDNGINNNLVVMNLLPKQYAQNVSQINDTTSKLASELVSNAMSEAVKELKREEIMKNILSNQDQKNNEIMKKILTKWNNIAQKDKQIEQNKLNKLKNIFSKKELKNKDRLNNALTEWKVIARNEKIKNIKQQAKLNDMFKKYTRKIIVKQLIQFHKDSQKIKEQLLLKITELNTVYEIAELYKIMKNYIK